MSDLHGVTIAFDIDGTLLDPDGSTYRRTTQALLAAGDLGMDPAGAWDAYESIRVLGRAMERLGLANANHFRGHPEALSALCILHAEHPAHRGAIRLSIHFRDVIRDSLLDLDAALPDRGEPDWRKRLAAERRVRSLLKCDVSLGMFRDEVRRVAGLSFMVEWSSRYADIESQAALHDPRPLLEALRSRGAKLVVISEGLGKVQSAKLTRLGLGHLFAGRAMITQDAGNVTGIDALERAVEPLLNASDDELDEQTRAELTLLWRFRCIANTWTTKSPWFFGRCLHAIRSIPDAPAKALRELAVVSPDAWRRDPLRLVMIGDRHDRDVAPLHEAVGPEGCRTIRLRSGRYAGDFDESELPPDRRPTRTFTDWDSLAAYLMEELARDAVPPLSVPPPIVPPATIDAELISAGQRSDFDAARLIAGSLAATCR